MMRRTLVAVFGCAMLPGPQVAGAQTHKVAKPESVVRAIGVYEWTGDLAKPAASRFIPVTVFIDGQLQDGGVYLARPVPFALQSGNYYELEAAGVSKGGLELAYARHLQAVDTATGATEFDDGWFGYGSFKPPVTAKKSAPLRVSKDVAEVKGSKDDGRPHFGGRSADPKSSDSKSSDSQAADSKTDDSGSASSSDADRPTMRRRSGSGDTDSSKSTSKTGAGTSGTSSSGADAGSPADDPDRPKLTKKSGSDSSDPTVAGDTDGRPSTTKDSGTSGTTTSTPTTAQGGSADDPDRPTLKRRTVEEMKKDRKREDSASVSGVGSLNNDPDRPNLHRGKPTSAMTEDDLPKLKGLPADLKQIVAVSDAVNRPVHEFARPWEDDKERSAILIKMQALARAKLAEYGARLEPAVTAAPAPAVKATPSTTAARRTAAVKRKPVAAPEVALMEEELKGYLLSYGGAPTYVYTAHTAGTGAALDYVTVVAQADAMGELKPAITSVTDAAHLDRTPRMRLVDAVDAEANNRASLLFELRGQRSRQFGLYSVIGSRVDQRFLSGSTQ